MPLVGLKLLARLRPIVSLTVAVSDGVVLCDSSDQELIVVPVCWIARLRASLETFRTSLLVFYGSIPVVISLEFLSTDTDISILLLWEHPYDVDWGR